MNIKINIAESYNELSDWQLRQVMFAIDRKYRGKMLILFVLMILVMKRKTFRNAFKLFVLITNVPLLHLAKDIEFIFQLKELTRFVKKLRYRGYSFYGPGDRLANLTAEEYSFADLFYYQWITENDTAALDRLVTVLYRPIGDRKSASDIREVFNKDRILLHAKYIEKIDKSMKIAVGYAFGGSRSLIEKQFKYVFPKRKNLPKVGKYQSFEKAIRQMVRGERQPLGNLYQTRASNIYDFLNVLNDDIKETIELEKKYNK